MTALLPCRELRSLPPMAERSQGHERAVPDRLRSRAPTTKAGRSGQTIVAGFDNISAVQALVKSGAVLATS